MTEEREITNFIELFNGEVIDECRGGSGGERSSPDFKENAFTKIFTENLKENGIIEDAECCYICKTTGKGNVKANGYYYDENTNQLTLLLSLMSDTNSKVPTPSEIAQLSKQPVRLFWLAITDEGIYKDLEPSSSEFSMMQRIYQLKEEIKSVRILILIEGIVDGMDKLNKIKAVKEDRIKFKFDIYDLRRLYRVTASDERFEDIQIDLATQFGTSLKCIHEKSINDSYETYITVFPAKILNDIYDDYGDQLLELNVRSYLQAKTKVNKGIRNTLNEHPEWFLAYNNGITIVATKVATSNNHDGNLQLTSITGMQIVNGAQTVASIHRAITVDNIPNISGVNVLAKITTVDPKLLNMVVPNISLYSNSQNKISEADFTSNHPFHIKIEILSGSIWVPGQQSRWFYERARGQYQVAKAKEGTEALRRRFEEKCPRKQMFTKTDLAKYVNSWLLLPHIVSRGAQKNYVYYMSFHNDKYGRDWLPEKDYYLELIGKAILFRETDRMAAELRIPALKANVVTYTIAYLRWRTQGRIDFKKIWDIQKLSSALEETLRSWIPQIHQKIVESAGDRNHGEWCKNAECWETVKLMNLNISDSFNEEINVNQPLPTVGREEERNAESLTSQDRENIALVIKIDAETLFKVQQWGAKNQSLASWQLGILHTLQGYATKGWSKVPSKAQARHVVDIMKKVVVESDIKVEGFN
ncbi:MAG: hypothetical protein A2351_00015 [Omnitrophica bacterium RIFOXYB12_FULL_50_7]|nr:MAG: hypothetical protein A2351_00015 [Omnitrophica bacterium RIFOXYB12_FULL_50_7]